MIYPNYMYLDIICIKISKLYVFRYNFQFQNRFRVQFR
jgi:hypothetical protein